MNVFKMYLTVCLSAAFLLLGTGLVSGQAISPFHTEEAISALPKTITYESSHSTHIIKKNVSHGTVTFSQHEDTHNLYNLTYTSDDGFIGRDTFIFQYWIFSGHGLSLEQMNVIFDVRAFILVDDYYVIDFTEEWTEFDVLINDESLSLLNLEVIPFTSKCDVQITDNNTILFKASESGVSYFKYVACDDVGRCNPASVMVSVKEPVSGSSDEVINRSTLKNNPISIYLQDDGFDLLQSPANGSVSFTSDFIVEYLPNQEYHGNDSFVLEAVDGDDIHTITVHINVINFGSSNTLVIDDFFNTVVNEPITFNVRENDLETISPTQSFTQPSNGTIVNLGSGNFSYTPNNNFKGIDAFTYRICPVQAAGCETGIVKIQVNNLKPDETTFQFTTAKNVPYVVRYVIPINSFDFVVTESPIMGDLTFYPGNQVVQVAGQEISGYNLLIYEPGFDAVGIDEMRVQYCAGTECLDIKLDIEIIDYFPDINCFDDCVWPGDINSDGRVDMMDLMPLAYYIGYTGAPRSSDDPLMWLGSSAEDWGQSQVFNGANLKHADGNGDGILSMVDTASIASNYMKYHQFVGPSYNPLLEVPFNLIPPDGTFSEGDTAVFDIEIGNAQFPALDFMGLCFELDFVGSDYIDLSSIKVHLEQNNWLTTDAPSLGMTFQPSDSRVDAGLARADGRYSSGFGIVGRLEFIVVKDIDGFHPATNNGLVKIPVRLENGHAMTADGRMYSVPDMESSVFLRLDSNVGIGESVLSVFPNPATSEVNVRIKGTSTINHIELISLTGQVAFTQDFSSTKEAAIVTSHLKDGFYLVRATTNEGVVVSKVQIIK